jgi:uncharacterized protein
VSSDQPFARAAGGLRLALKVTPRAAHNRIGETVAGPAGGYVLKVAVTAAAEGGKANDAVIRLLSRQWRVPKSAMRVISGHTDRRKLLFIAGDPADLAARIGAAITAREAKIG